MLCAQVLMVVSAEQAEAVIAEAAAGLAEGAVVVLCSTVPPSAAKRMAAQLASMVRPRMFWAVQPWHRRSDEAMDARRLLPC